VAAPFRPLHDGETIRLGAAQLTVLHTPGHTPGHCALLLEERGVLFSGDALVTLDSATGRTGPQPVRWNDDPEQERASFERLRALDVAVVYPGHGEPA